MWNVSGRLHDIRQMATVMLQLGADTWCFLGLCLRPAPALAAEILFLRKQLALYEERHIQPRRATNAARLVMVWLSHWFDWRPALRIVKPETLTRWHHQGFRLLWRRKSKPGRLRIPTALQLLIKQMAQDNPTWGQERIANALLLKRGLRVSPRTVRKDMPNSSVGGPGQRCQAQRWSTFIRNHAKGIVACDCFVVVTVTFRLLYVFVMIEHERRRLIHVNVTAHPTAQWTLQQFREAILVDHGYRFLIYDRDAIFSNQVDQGVRHMGLRVLKTPVRTPVANAICERVIGTLRRECLDFVIARNACHLFGLLKAWVTHYNEGRPYMSLGPGIPQPRAPLPVSHQVHRHQIPRGQRVVTRSVLNGLHQDYGLDHQVA